MKKLRLLGVVVVLSLMFMPKGMAQKSKFQALYIYNICRFVEWPANFNNDKFVIGVVGDDSELMENLNNIASSKTIQGKRIVVKAVTSVHNSQDCNILFFEENVSVSIPAYLRNNKSALFVSESEGAITKGADINFVTADNKLKYVLGSTNLTKKSLNYSRDLKSMAYQVL